MCPKGRNLLRAEERKNIPLEEFGDMKESNSDKPGEWEQRGCFLSPKHSRIPGEETYSQVISGIQ